MGLGDFFSSVCDFVSDAFTTFCDGASLIIDSFSGFAETIAAGIKDICEGIGVEGMLLIGSIALSLIVPGVGIPELLTIIQIVGQIALSLNVGGDDTPEELGMKAEIAEKKPTDFDSTEAYINYLNEEVTLDEGLVGSLSPEDKVKYGLIGSALDIKAIQEKYKIELSPDFLRDVALLDLSGEEVATCVKEFSEQGITKMEDMTNYIRGNETNVDKQEISSCMTDTLKELYPELSEEQINDKLCELADKLESVDL